MNPRVSVIIPNYNHDRFLENRILSVLKQTYQDFEVICLDDASTDSSMAILDKYRNRSRFEIVVNSKNSGSPFHQWNKGIRTAKGEYIWIAESDDLAKLDLLENLVRVLDKNENVGLAYCQSLYLTADHNITGSHVNELSKFDDVLWKSDFIQNGRTLLGSHMAAINIIPNASALLFRKNIFEQAGGADERMKLCGDWLAWSKMLLISDLAFIDKPLNYFRVHNQSVRSHIHRTHRYILEYLYVVRFIFSKVLISTHARRRVAYQLKARWIRLPLENPKEITFALAFYVCREIHLLLGFWQAAQFLLIGLISMIHFGFKDSFKTKYILKVIRSLVLKHSAEKMAAEGGQKIY